MTRLLARLPSALLVTMLAACEVGVGGGGELPAPGEPIVNTRRCPHCGWIESKRELPSLPDAADPGAPRSYEYTVRMTDGSSNVFRETLPASWRLGERLMVIGAVSASAPK